MTFRWVEKEGKGVWRSTVPFPGRITYPVFLADTKTEATDLCKCAAKEAVIGWLYANLPDKGRLSKELFSYLKSRGQIRREFDQIERRYGPAPVYLIVAALPCNWARRILLALGRSGLIR